MNSIIKKLKLLILPLLLLAIICVVTYTFLHWIFIIKLKLINIDEAIIKLWIPLVLPWFPVLIFFRKRILLLNVKNKKEEFRIRFFYYLLSSISITAPIIISQEYIETATGKLTSSSSLKEIATLPETKYYDIKNYVVDKKHSGVDGVINISGKNNHEMEMVIYIACPMRDSLQDAGCDSNRYWYGIIYRDNVENPKDPKVEQTMWNKFYQKSIFDFEQNELPHPPCLDRIGNSADQKGLIHAINKVESIPDNKDIFIFCPMQISYAERNGQKLPWIFGSFAIGAIIFLLFIAAVPFNEEKLNAFVNKKS